MGKTKIQWTNMSWPVVTGCSHAGSPGCDMCYAARMTATRLKHHPRYEGLATIENGRARWTGKVNLNRDVLEQPLHWRKPRMVFVASMGDLFHDGIPEEFIFRVLRVAQNTPQHIYQILTKRPGRMTPVMHEYYARLRAVYGSKAEEPQRNLWLGTSVENQAAADERISLLLQIPAAVRFVSVEPMLEAIVLPSYDEYIYPDGFENNGPMSTTLGYSQEPDSQIDWVICGGESGLGARPMHPDWARSLRDQCQAAIIPYFFKQHGAWLHSTQLVSATVNLGNNPPTYNWPDASTSYRVGKKRAGRLLDGRTWDEMPKRGLE